jgi:hypothetical protein
MELAKCTFHELVRTVSNLFVRIPMDSYGFGWFGSIELAHLAAPRGVDRIVDQYTVRRIFGEAKAHLPAAAARSFATAVVARSTRRAFP